MRWNGLCQNELYCHTGAFAGQLLLSAGRLYGRGRRCDGSSKVRSYPDAQHRNVDALPQEGQAVDVRQCLGDNVIDVSMQKSRKSMQKSRESKDTLVACLLEVAQHQYCRLLRLAGCCTVESLFVHCTLSQSNYCVSLLQLHGSAC